MNGEEYEFSAPISKRDYDRMVYAVVYVPAAIKKKLSDAARVRVIGTMHGLPYRGAIQPTAAGKHYLLLSRKWMKSARVAFGDKVVVRLSLDDPNAVELVPEFERALNANPTALRVWQQLTPGRRRGLAYRIASAKQSATRNRRIEECLDSLRD